MAPKRELSLPEAVEMVSPGLHARLVGHGGGFEVEYEPEKTVDDAGNVLTLSISFSYTFPNENIKLSFKLRVRKKGFTWKYLYYSYHCGPKADEYRDLFFRIDFNPSRGGPHVHLPHLPGNNLHLPFSHVDPPLTGIDACLLPKVFLDFVEQYRQERRIPLKKSKP